MTREEFEHKKLKIFKEIEDGKETVSGADWEISELVDQLLDEVIGWKEPESNERFKIKNELRDEQRERAGL